MSRPAGACIVVLVLALSGTAGGVTVAGGGKGSIDYLVELVASGLGFPAGKAVFKGSTCADGDPCDADGVRNGSCLFMPMICLNQADPALPNCGPAQVKSIHFKAKDRNGKKMDTSALDAAVAALGLPSTASTCSPLVDFVVP